jgi:hypothetical protein
VSYHVSILTTAEDDDGDGLTMEFPGVDEHNYVGNWVVIVSGSRTLAFPSDGILSVATRPDEEKEATVTSVTFE